MIIINDYISGDFLTHLLYRLIALAVDLKLKFFAEFSDEGANKIRSKAI